jgi:alanyl-tRNA synthetase
MTDRLYYTDSYLKDFDATVIHRADDGRRVYLDRTAFYPTSGGQPFDTGRLGGVEVTDVIDEGERIAHLLAGSLSEGPTSGHVDWSRRFDHMQQHTGQHLLSAVLADLFGYRTIGVHFGHDSSTLDLEAGTLTQEQADRAEERANEIVMENRPVVVSFEEASAAAGLRKPSDRGGTLRIVSILDIDRSACGGTHVRATGEIGLIVIRKVERVRQVVRLGFLCGGRAIRQTRNDRRLLARLAAAFSSGPEDLPQLVEAEKEELKEAQLGRREVQASLDLYRARELYAAATPDATGIRRAVLLDSGEPLESLRGLAQAFASMPMAMFVGGVASPPAIVLAASPDTRVDAAEVLKGLLASVGGRGGGSASLAQGVVPGRTQLEAVVKSICGKAESLESKV